MTDSPSWQPTNEQEQLAQVLRAFLATQVAKSAELRMCRDTGRGVDSELWRMTGRELDLHGLTIPERFGGADGGVPELAIVLAEIGRAAVPTPLGSTLLAAHALATSDDPEAHAEVLRAIAAGDVAVALVTDPDGPMAVTERDGHWFVDGMLARVRDGAQASFLVIDDPSQVHAVIVTAQSPAVQAIELVSLDLNRRFADVRFTSAQALPLLTSDRSAWRARVLALQMVAEVSESLGGAEWCHATAVDYAKMRKQFGRPIGSFQAIKHLLADMTVDLELARSVHAHAVTALANSETASADVLLAAATDLVSGLRCAMSLAENTIQILGGIGFTWEHPAHLHFRRAHTAAVTAGLPQLLDDIVTWGVLTAPDAQLDGAARNAAGQNDGYVGRVRTWLSEHGVVKGEVRSRSTDPAAYVQGARVFQRQRFEAGLTGVALPPELSHGGGPASRLGDLAALFAPYETYDDVFTIGLSMCLPVLVEFGTVEQKQRHLEPLARADELWCQLFSEPGAGSDLASLQARAVRDGDEWVISGQKVWTSWAREADWGLLLARTDPTVANRHGITMFLLNMRTPGITVRPLRQITGESEFNEVFLDDVRVPVANVVGIVGDGWKAATFMLAQERIALGRDATPVNVSVTVRTLGELLTERHLDADPAARRAVGEAYVLNRGVELLGARTTAMVDAGQDPGPFASIGKLATARLVKSVARTAVELAGPSAVIWDEADTRGGSLSHGLLFAPSMSIAGGTDQIQRSIVGERLLGLPREPR